MIVGDSLDRMIGFTSRTIELDALSSLEVITRDAISNCTFKTLSVVLYFWGNAICLVDAKRMVLNNLPRLPSQAFIVYIE